MKYDEKGESRIDRYLVCVCVRACTLCIWVSKLKLRFYTMSIYILLCLEPLILALKIAEICINIYKMVVSRRFVSFRLTVSLCTDTGTSTSICMACIVKSLFAVKLIIKV